MIPPAGASTGTISLRYHTRNCISPAPWLIAIVSIGDGGFSQFVGIMVDVGAGVGRMPTPGVVSTGWIGRKGVGVVVSEIFGILHEKDTDDFPSFSRYTTRIVWNPSGITTATSTFSLAWSAHALMSSWLSNQTAPPSSDVMLKMYSPVRENIPSH